MEYVPAPNPRNEPKIDFDDLLWFLPTCSFWEDFIRFICSEMSPRIAIILSIAPTTAADFSPR